MSKIAYFATALLTPSFRADRARPRRRVRIPPAIRSPGATVRFAGGAAVGTIAQVTIARHGGGRELRRAARNPIVGTKLAWLLEDIAARLALNYFMSILVEE